MLQPLGIQPPADLAELAEPVLATACGRIRWALSHMAIAVAGSGVLLVVAGAAVRPTTSDEAKEILHALTKPRGESFIRVVSFGKFL